MYASLQRHLLLLPSPSWHGVHLDRLGRGGPESRWRKGGRWRVGQIRLLHWLLLAGREAKGGVEVILGMLGVLSILSVLGLLVDLLELSVLGLKG